MTGSFVSTRPDITDELDRSTECFVHGLAHLMWALGPREALRFGGELIADLWEEVDDFAEVQEGGRPF